MLVDGPCYRGRLLSHSPASRTASDKPNGNSIFTPPCGIDWRCTMQTETMVSARPSAHPGHLADDPFSREFDLADLLSIVPATPPTDTTKTFVLAAAREAEPEPLLEPQPKSRNDIFTAYLQFERDLSRLSAEQGDLQKLLFGEDWPTIVDRPSTQGIYRVAEQAIANLIRIARTRFAPAGVVLEINQHDALEAIGMSRWSENYHRPSRRGERSESEATSAPPVDLDKLWNHLESTYGGDAGIETAHRQNAQFIIKELRLDGDSEMKRTASSVSCFRRIYASKKDYGADIGRYDFGHSSRDWLLQLFKGLACAFEWAGLDQLSIELAPTRHRICNYEFTFKPRDRHSFTGLDIVFFKEQMELKFSHSAAEKLMLYLGTYGQS